MKRFTKFLNRLRPEPKDSSGKSPLNSACYHGYESLTMSLIQSGSKVNTKDNDGCSPLHYASSVGVVKALIRTGANVKSKDKAKRTPLHLARSVRIARVLIVNGAYAEMNVRDDKWRSPLYYACRANNLELVKLLIRNGARASIVDQYRRFPYEYASSEAIVKYLKPLTLTACSSRRCKNSWYL